MGADYAYIKKWRAKNPGYKNKWMRDRRAYFKRMWKEGRIKYEDIPKSFRPGRLREVRQA